MSDSLRPVTRSRVYEQVVDRLREYALTEGLVMGDRLPAERDLAERLGVSRTSVRQAILALEVQGLVAVRHGGGSYVAGEWSDVESVEVLLERKRRLPAVLDARDALEAKLAELAALRRTEQEMADIDAALTQMEADIDNGGLGVVGDELFHRTITISAHSEMLASFMGEIEPEITESRRESLRQDGRPRQSLAQHRQIAEAIRRQDADAAGMLMRRHVRSVGDVKLLEWEED